MGAWGAGHFENDMAMDWLGPIQNYSDETPIRAAFQRAIDQSDYLVVDDGAEVVAAAATLACLLGTDLVDVPDELKDWIQASECNIDHSLLSLAIAAIDRTTGKNSELAELWSENPDYYPAWKESVEDLRAKISEKI